MKRTQVLDLFYPRKTFTFSQLAKLEEKDFEWKDLGASPPIQGENGRGFVKKKNGTIQSATIWGDQCASHPRVTIAKEKPSYFCDSETEEFIYDVTHWVKDGDLD